MPTAWLQNSGTNWPGLRGHSQLRRCRTPRALPTGAYPLASLVLHCLLLGIHGATPKDSTAPAVGTKRRKQCVSTPPLIKIRAEYQCEHVLHRFVKSQLNITPGIQWGPQAPWRVFLHYLSSREERWCPRRALDNQCGKIIRNNAPGKPSVREFACDDVGIICPKMGRSLSRHSRGNGVK